MLCVELSIDMDIDPIDRRRHFLPSSSVLVMRGDVVVQLLVALPRQLHVVLSLELVSHSNAQESLSVSPWCRTRPCTRSVSSWGARGPRDRGSRVRTPGRRSGSCSMACGSGRGEAGGSQSLKQSSLEGISGSIKMTIVLNTFLMMSSMSEISRSQTSSNSSNCRHKVNPEVQLKSGEPWLEFK